MSWEKKLTDSPRHVEDVPWALFCGHSYVVLLLSISPYRDKTTMGMASREITEVTGKSRRKGGFWR